MDRTINIFKALIRTILQLAIIIGFFVLMFAIAFFIDTTFENPVAVLFGSIIAVFFGFWWWLNYMGYKYGDY